MRVLSGDIGGTKTRIALVEIQASGVRLSAQQRYDSAAFDGLEAIVAAFVREHSATFERAGFGVAGPVIDDVAEITNLPWRIDRRALAKQLGVETRLINDLGAAALGVTRLEPKDLAAINDVPATHGAPIAVLGAGTGLGEAFMVWNGTRYEVVASEGGHADFAPRNEQQCGLLRALIHKYGHVSYERVVSGMGVAEMYEYLRASHFAPESPDVRAALDAGKDLGAVIGEHALAGTDALSSAVIDLLVDAYGAEAGNMALKVVARGGVYLVGGIAPKLLPKLRDGRFFAAFVDKGRFRGLLESIPVHVVMHPDVALIGAAVAATR